MFLHSCFNRKIIYEHMSVFTLIPFHLSAVISTQMRLHMAFEREKHIDFPDITSVHTSFHRLHLLWVCSEVERVRFIKM